jgi:hypothetical protein
MSAISSDLSSTATQVAQLQQLAQGASGKTHAHHGHRGPGGAQFKQAFTNAAESAGLDASKANDVQNQIDEALKNAKANGASRDSVQSTIDNILKNNGVDVDKFHEALKSEFDKQRAQSTQNSTGAPVGLPDETQSQNAESLTPGSVDVIA